MSKKKTNSPENQAEESQDKQQAQQEMADSVQTDAPQPEQPEAEQPETQEPADDEARKKYDSLNEKYLRTLAEYDNYRKRSIRERESIYPEARADAAAKFLPVMDNLERALSIETEKNPFYDGVVLVKKQLDEVFTKLGIEVIEAGEGTAFDPELHEAVMHVEDENLGENVIAQELQKGYKMGDRIIRHSMVKVAN